MQEKRRENLLPLLSDVAFHRKRREDLRRYLEASQFTHMVTVNYQKPVTGSPEEREQTLRRDLKHWACNMLEALYGRKFPERNKNDELLFFAFLETGMVLKKDHWHILARVPFRFWPLFKDNVALCPWNWWKNIWVDVKSELIDDVGAAVKYCTKDMTINPDRMVMSSEFRRSR